MTKTDVFGPKFDLNLFIGYYPEGTHSAHSASFAKSVKNILSKVRNFRKTCLKMKKFSR